MECKHENIYAVKKGNQVDIYCKDCDVKLRPANKKERKMIGNGEIELKNL